jgi:hypothetical protein
MKALVYRCTRPVVGWRNAHERNPRGYAYQNETQFVHVYGAQEGLWPISPGLTISIGKEGTGALEDWVRQAFGALDIETSNFDVGLSIEAVWRPGIFFDADMFAGLAQTSIDLRVAEQRLLLILERLDEIFLFVEPTKESLDAFGHKTRELLILACTEVEAYWKYYLVKAGVTEPKHGFRTTDYARVKEPLHLAEFEIAFPRYEAVPPLRPFATWNPAAATQTLDWYSQYNATKHDGLNHLKSASLSACLWAVAANVVMFSVRFGPHRLFGGAGMLSALVNSMLTISLRDCDVKSFYVPRLAVEGRGENITWGHADTIPPTPLSFQL